MAPPPHPLLILYHESGLLGEIVKTVKTLENRSGQVITDTAKVMREV